MSHVSTVCICDGLRKAGVTVSAAIRSQAKALLLQSCAAICF
jgi:hypothetical protein